MTDFGIREANPWWHSPWIWGPALVGSAILFGAGLGVAVRRLRRRQLPPADCTRVGDDGGTLNGIRYLERMRGGAHPDEQVPMVVLFHSRGAAPEGFAGMLQGIGKARLIIPEGTLTSGSGRSWFGAPVRAGAQSSHPGVVSAREATAQQLANFVGQAIQCRPTMGRPILTGSSQGAEMTLILASTRTHLVHGGVAVNGYLLPPFWNTAMAPVAMLHGTGDEVVPFLWAQDYAAQMEGAGADISFAAFPSTGHGVTKAMSNAWNDAVRTQVEELGG